MKCSAIASAANCALSRLLLSAILVAAFHPASAQTTTPVRKNPATHSWSVRWQPAQLVNGSPIVFQVTPPVRLTALSGKWLKHEVLFSYDAAGRNWYGIAGISLETRPGTYTLELRGTTSRGSEDLIFTQNYCAGSEISQHRGDRRQAVHRAQQGATGTHSTRTRRSSRTCFSHTDPEREWSGKFRPPVDAPVSDVFGTRAYV